MFFFVVVDLQKKSKKNEGGEKKNNSGEVVQKKEGGEKKHDGNLTVVLKSDFHCEGCVTKVVKAIKSVGGKLQWRIPLNILQKYV